MRYARYAGEFSLAVFLFSGGFSGAVAGALTTPLDVIKTRLQALDLTTRDFTRLYATTTRIGLDAIIS